VWVAGALLLVCALACAPDVRAQMPEVSAPLDANGRWVNGVTESWWVEDGLTEADARGAAARWKSIGDEVAGAAGTAGWVGDYFRGGETHGTYMRWSPGAGFVIADVDKCRAAVVGLVYGRVEASPGLVQFFPEFDRKSSHTHGGGHQQAEASAPLAARRFVPVRWRGERLLVAEEEMADFGDYVAGLGRYNRWISFILLEHVSFFSRMGASDDGEGGAPVVPPGYERFLKSPVEAAVTSVGRRDLRRDYHIEDENTSMTFERASLTYVTISAGAEHGVKPGMIFRVARGGDEEADSLLVVRAGRRASTAVVVREVDERGAETYYSHAESREKRRSKVAAGWKVTTSPHD
jgi:hypothetical protein